MELFKQPKAAGAILLARLLTLDVQVLSHKITEMLFKHYGVDYCAGKWYAYSKYQYCASCGTVAVLSVPMPVTIHMHCGNCADNRRSTLRTLSRIEDVFTRVEPAVQTLALEYLYWRQHGTSTESTTEHNDNSSTSDSTTDESVGTADSSNQ